MDQLRGRKARLVRIYGSKPTTTRFCSKPDKTGFCSRSSTRGDLEVVFEDWALDWKPENAKKIVNAAITAKGRNLDAILA